VFSLKVTTIGSSLGLILPKKMLVRLKVAKGGKIFLGETPEGLRITRRTPAVGKQMLAARKIMQRRRAVLGQLCK